MSLRVHLWAVGLAGVWIVASSVRAQGPPSGPIRGGRLYDTWWAVTGTTPPTSDHPLWQYRPDPVSNPRTGAETWRCKECHGWDYKGVDGAYGTGSHRTGFPGILGTTLSAGELFTLLREPPSNGGGPGVLNGHDYGSVLSDADIHDLVQFVLTQLIDVDVYLEPGTHLFLGDPVQGETYFQQGGVVMACAICHGPDGTWHNFGTYDEPEWVGTVASENPWEFMHKVRFGQPGEMMPSWAMHSSNWQGIADLGRYVQDNLPENCTDFGDFNLDHNIDLTDLSLLLAAFGTCDGDPGFDPVLDMDDSGCVDLTDLSLLLTDFGGMCP